MREREQIEEAFRKETAGIKPEYATIYGQKIVLEVLLDIRELLDKLYVEQK